jgi:hypothetical protein
VSRWSATGWSRNVGRWESNYGSVSFEYLWRRCAPEYRDCECQSAGRSYSLGRDDAGHVIELKVIAKNDHGETHVWTHSEIVRSA